MHVAVLAALALSMCLSACVSSRQTIPREYLDEQTAATITVVKEPLIFTRAPSKAHGQRDFLHLYAIDVNRMGDHRQYFAALQSNPGELTNPPVLQITVGGQTKTLEPIAESAREVGIAQPIAEAYTIAPAWWYYPVDKQTLATLANARDLDAQLIAHNEYIEYVLWRDGRGELSELTAVLP
jgi:hypothetical protein